jgi:FtsZ-binding cell division protein ZapB
MPQTRVITRSHYTYFMFMHVGMGNQQSSETNAYLTVEIAELRETVKYLTAEIAKLHATVKYLTAKNDELHADNERQKDIIKYLTAKNDELHADNERQKDIIKYLTAKNDELHVDNERLTAEIAELKVSAQRRAIRNAVEETRAYHRSLITRSCCV